MNFQIASEGTLTADLIALWVYIKHLGADLRDLKTHLRLGMREDSRPEIVLK